MTKDKQELYELVLHQLDQYLCGSSDPVARMATIVAILHTSFDHFFWTGFYTLIDGRLTVGPYQGSPACLVLEAHTGVCWAGVDRRQPVVVANVHEFPGHIVCDGRANSEIVVPLRNRDGEVIGVLDVDSADFDSFGDVDVEFLQRIVARVFPEDKGMRQ
ncbi:MAG: GAF domain-containing protein [Deltaproteobacteria bacterium]|nr:GAF domain-containing protein [Deltaproteobacteria bacterium]